MNISFASKWIRLLLLIGVITTLVGIIEGVNSWLIIKSSRMSTEYEFYEHHFSFPIFSYSAFILIFIGSFLNDKARVIVCSFGMIWVIGIFGSWYYQTYDFIYNWGISWKRFSEESFLGLHDARWSDALLLFIAFILVIVWVFEISRFLKSGKYLLDKQTK